MTLKRVRLDDVRVESDERSLWLLDVLTGFYEGCVRHRSVKTFWISLGYEFGCGTKHDYDLEQYGNTTSMATL